ncbi:MAG: Tfp pilus assembly protein PilX [Parasphingorhabdus sp.]
MANTIRRSKQRGMSLVVSLILLTLMTALGVTALRTTSLDQQLAGNMQQQVKAFQGAEIGIVKLWNEVAGVTTSDTENTDTVTTYICTDTTITCDNSAPVRAKITIVTDSWYVGEGQSAPPGYSLDGPFSSHHFHLKSTSSHAGKEVKINSGFYRVGPAQAAN